MKKLSTLFVLALVVAFSASVVSAEESTQGQTNETKMQLKDATKGAQKQTDEEITNARMRAQSGSKSKLSMSFSLAYEGGSVEKPLAAERPALSMVDDGTPKLADITGTISGRYRLNERDSFTLGSGIVIYEPFHSSLESSDQASKNTNVDNPYFAYNRSFKMGDYQNKSSIGYTYVSKKNSRESLDLQGYATLNHTTLKSLGTSGFTAGAQLYFAKYVYGSKDIPLEYQTDVVAGLYPFVEYEINDRYSLRTLFGYFVYYNQRSDTDMLRLTKDDSYQSIGVGIAITRDIYLYPNVQFLPEDIRSDKTNVGLSADLNLF